MNKNRLLIVLACLNCVHTTHAVEKSENMNIQHAGQDSLETLRVQYPFQGMLCSAMYMLKDPDMMHDALIKGATIMWELDKHVTDALSQDDPARPDYEALVSIRREIVEEIKSLNKNDLINADLTSDSLFASHLDKRLDKKLQSLFAKKQIKLHEQPILQSLFAKHQMKLDEQTIKNMTRAYLYFWYKAYPQLNHKKGMDYAPFPSPISSRKTLSTIQRAIREGNLTHVLSDHDNMMKDLAKRYPDIAKQTWNVNSKLWAHDVNRLLDRWAQGETYWLDNLGNVLQQLDQSGTQLGQVMAQANLGQIRNNLIGEDGDLKEKTIALLANDPVLTDMVFDGPEMEKMLTDRKIPLNHAFAVNKKDRSLTRLPKKLVNLDVVKYL
jgi:hypothetical protein